MSLKVEATRKLSKDVRRISEPNTQGPKDKHHPSFEPNL
jgi:hypothetical protein